VFPVYRWTDLSRTPEALRPCVLTLGNFDGVHRGHRAVLTALVEAGHRLGLPAVAITFDPHPAQVLRPHEAPELITPAEVRDDLIAECGIDGLLVLDFTREFAAQTPEDFVRSVFVRGLDARSVVVGMDTRFGYRNAGDVSTLSDLGEHFGFEVVALDDVGDGERFSSTVVRRHLRAGEVAEAARILGRPHRVVGIVVHGNHRGRALGYPTANLATDSLGLVPLEGVYAGWLTRLEASPRDPDRTMPAAISVGTNPTFDTDDPRTVEAYVLDRDDLELYDEKVMVEFTAHIRPTLRFDTVEDLTTAMAQDVERCRELLTKIVPA
jgi:riboflavin kinase/FMN adenylyltransferase